MSNHPVDNLSPTKAESSFATGEVPDQRENPAKLLVIDDHAIVRRGVADIIRNDSLPIQITEASTASSAIKLLRTQTFDIIILDLNLPDRQGLDLLKDIRCEFPKVPVLVLTMHSEQQYAERILKAGAKGFLNKSSLPDDLVRAITTLLNGQAYLNEETQKRFLKMIDRDCKSLPHERLSDREFQIFLLISKGFRLIDIANELSISIKTVSTFKARILNKMQLSSNAEILSYALSHDLNDQSSL